MTAPLVSVILPAFQATDTIARACRSVESCGLDPALVELVIASDDGTDYAPLVPPGPRQLFCAPGPVASGVGPARNRAMEAAGGTYFAFLDADDTWEPEYLAALLPLSRAAGLAFSPTSVLADAAEILRLPEADHLTFALIARSGASFRPLVHRDLAGRFRDIPSQDILHAVELLALAGGQAPVSERAYQLRLTAGSVTQSAGFSARLDAAYRTIIAAIENGETRVPAVHASVAADVFRAKIALNADYADQREFATYYAFIAARLQRERPQNS